MFFPQEIIDHIFVYLPVCFSIRIGDEYVKKILLKETTLAKRWKSIDRDFDLLSWLVKYEIKGYDMNSVLKVVELGSQEAIIFFINKNFHLY